MPEHVIYNSYKNPGDFIYKTTQLFKSNIFEDGTNILYSTNNDSILLCLITNVSSLYLMFGKFDTIVDIKLFRETIQNKNVNIFDYIDICNLLECQLLPRRHNISLEQIIKYYESVKGDITDRFLSDKNGIVWGNMLKLIEQIANNEEGLLTSNIEHNRSLLYPSNVLEKSIVSKETITDEETIMVESVDYNTYRDQYYKHYIDIKGDKSLLESLIGRTIEGGYHEEDILLLTSHFLKIQAYIHNLFFGIKIDWCMYYPYHYLPLFRDMFKQLANMNVEELRSLNNIGPVNNYYKGHYNLLHQLIAIIPPHKCKLLPSSIRHISCEYSELSDLYPSKYIIDREGITEENQSEPLIPFVNIDRVGLLIKDIMYKNYITYDDDETLTEFIFKYQKAQPYVKSSIKGYLIA